MKLKCRNKVILTWLVAFFCAIALAGCSGGGDGQQASAGDSGDVLKIRCANVMATGNNVTLGVEKFAELVKEKSNGSILIEVYSDAQLGSDRDTTEQVQSGTLDMATCSTDNFATFFPDIMAFALPGIVSPDNQEKLYDAIDHGELGAYYKTNMEAVGLHSVMFLEYGYRCFFSSSGSVASPDNLKSMKLRTTDSQVEKAVAEVLGATGMPVAWGETYTALQQGSCEGESNTFGLLEAAKHIEVLKYAATTEHNYSMHLLLMNNDLYQSLTEEQKTIIDEAAAEALAYERELSAENEAAAKQAFLDAGCEVVDLSQEQRAKWMEALSPVYDQMVPSVISQEAVELIRATQQ